MTHADIAEKLVAARTEQHLSLLEASAFTKIQLDHLARLEEGDFSFLPTAYIVPMLCKYAAALGIPNDEISSYRRAVVAPVAVASPASDNQTNLIGSVHGGSVAARERRAKETFSISPMQAVVVAAIALAAGGIFLGLRFFSTDNASAVIIRKDAKSEVASKTNAATAHSATTQAGATPKTAVPPPTVGNVTQKPLNQEAPTTIAGNASQKRLSLVVKTKKDSCWVNVVADKENSREAYLYPNQIQKFEADSLFTLSLGRAQAAEVWLNGKTVALPRRSGAVSNIRLSQKDL